MPMLSETWLKKSIPNKLVAVDGYTVFRAACLGKGGGVAILVKLKYFSSVHRQNWMLNCWLWKRKCE